MLQLGNLFLIALHYTGLTVSPSPLATLGSRYAALPVGGRAAALEDYGLRTHSYSYVSVLCCAPRVLGGGFRFSGEALGKA